MKTLSLLFLCAALVRCQSTDQDLRFDHESHIRHEKSGAEFYMKKSGKLAGVIDLDEYVRNYKAIKGVKCDRKGIHVLLDPEWDADPHEALGGHYDITQVWLRGMIVRSEAIWNNCKSTVDGKEIDGIYQKIKGVLHGLNQLFIITVPAGFADNFEELDYTVHHKRGNWTGVPEAEKEEHKHRVRRSIMTNDDLVARLTASVFEPNQHLSLKTNWNTQWNIVDQHVRLDSSESRATFYPNEALQIPGQAKYSPKNANNWWDMFCEQCYASLEADISAKMKIGKQEIKEFEVKVNGDFAMKRKFQIHTKGDNSHILETLISTTTGTVDIPVLVFNDVLKKDVTMQLKYDFSQYVNMDVKFEAVDSNFEFDILEEGTLSMTFSRQADGTLQMSHNYQQVKSEVGDPVYNFEAVLESGKAQFKTKLDMELVINWGDQEREAPGKGKIYLFNLDTDMTYKIELSQTVDFSTYILGYGSVCVRPTHDLWLSSDVSQSSLEYKVLGKIYWRDRLYPALKTSNQIRGETEFALCQDPEAATSCCFVQLTGNAELNAGKSPEQACGAIIMAISRDMNEFYSNMIQMKSNSILFKNEEHTQQWCGSMNYPCSDCRKDVAGYTKPAICADRHMSLDMSEAVRSLAELVKKAYPKRKLMVINAFDEPTQLHPMEGTNWGKFRFDSVHKEGRGAQLAISRELTDDEMNYDFTTMPNEDLDPNLMHKLGQMAVMAQFDFVKIHSENVHVCVELGSWGKGTASSNSHFADLINSTYAAGITLSECNKFAKLFPQLLRGMQRPKGMVLNDACGVIGIPITRYHKRQFGGLCYYTYNDVEFRNPKRNDAWCGMPGRACIDCRVNTESNVPPEKRCRDRVMTCRTMYRLRRLVKLVQEKWGDDNKLMVEFSWDEPTETAEYKWGTWKIETSHHRVAQGLWLNLTGSDGQGKLIQLGQLAQCAGFDFVEYPPAPKPKIIRVCTKRENKPRSFVVPFPTAQLQASRPGFFATNAKYAYPGKCNEGDSWCDKIDPIMEPYYSQYFDSSIYKTDKLVGNLTLLNFTKERFVRIDQYLVECVGNLIGKGGLKLNVKAAFRNQPDNLANIETKHDEEKVRHQTGHAVIVDMATGTTGKKELIAIGKAVIKICGNQVNPQQRMLGIGIHKDELYFDFRPKPWDAPPPVAALMWTHDGGEKTVKTALKKWLKVIQGGPPISVLDEVSACKFKLDVENYYFNFKLDAGFFADFDCTKTRYNPTWCKTTLTHRDKLLKKATTMLRKKARLSSSHNNIKKALENCIRDLCNECTEGPV